MSEQWEEVQEEGTAQRKDFFPNLKNVYTLHV